MTEADWLAAYLIFGVVLMGKITAEIPPRKKGEWLAVALLVPLWPALFVLGLWNANK